MRKVSRKTYFGEPRRVMGLTMQEITRAHGLMRIRGDLDRWMAATPDHGEPPDRSDVEAMRRRVNEMAARCVYRRLCEIYDGALAELGLGWMPDEPFDWTKPREIDLT